MADRQLRVGIPKAPHVALANDFPEPPTDTSIVAISQRGIIDVPSTSPDVLSSLDHLTIVYHLASILPKPPPPPPVASTSKQKDKKVKKQPSLTASTWKSLNLGGISNYLPSMPSMPGSSSSPSALEGKGNSSMVASTTASSKLPSAPMDALQTNKQVPADSRPSKSMQAGKRASSGSAWIPTFSLFGGSASAKTRASSDKLHPDYPKDSPSESYQPIQPLTLQEAPHVQAEHMDPPASAASEASMEALSEAMIDSISSEQVIQTPAPPGTPDCTASDVAAPADVSVQAATSIDEQKNVIWHESRIVFVGKDLRRMQCRCLHVSITSRRGF